MDDFVKFIIGIVCGIVLGCLIMANAHYQPIEDRLSVYCENIKSELKTYNLTNELVCINGAMFTYDLED